MPHDSSAHGLTREELHAFWENGYVGPFDAVAPDEEVESIAKKLLAHSRDRSARHPLYGRYSVRDWYLVYPELIRFVSHPRVREQLKSILGEHLILWRSNNFYKAPGTGPIGWHQDFGTFSGEDIGNNKPSLLPTHLDGMSEEVLEQYLPDALRLSKSDPAPDQSDFWNVTVWVALTDIEPGMGALRFLRGSYRRRYPVKMGQLPQSDFWQDPFSSIRSKAELVSACKGSYLVLDVDTSTILDDVPLAEHTFEELKGLVLRKLGGEKGSITDSDEVDEDHVEIFSMKKGTYMIFSERTLHGSLANTSDQDRLAINFRIARSSTLVYPLRLRGEYSDGFNLDISKHRSVLLSGENLNPHNVVMGLVDV